MRVSIHKHYIYNNMYKLNEWLSAKYLHILQNFKLFIYTSSSFLNATIWKCQGGKSYVFYWQYLNRPPDGGVSPESIISSCLKSFNSHSKAQARWQRRA